MNKLSKSSTMNLQQINQFVGDTSMIAVRSSNSLTPDLPAQAGKVKLSPLGGSHSPERPHW